jgi:hypothetical protein
VNNTSLDLHSIPVEGRMAVGTPHLRTATDLENHGSTFWTTFGILIQKFHSFDGVRVALVPFNHFFITVLADVFGARSTLPLSAQETPALFNGTLSNEFAFGFGGLKRSAIAKHVQLTFKVPDVLFLALHFNPSILQKFHSCPNLLFALNI